MIRLLFILILYDNYNYQQLQSLQSLQQLTMISKFRPKTEFLKIYKSSKVIHYNAYSFIIMKILKKRLKADQDKYNPKPHVNTYHAGQQNQKQNQVTFIQDDTNYDFFTRQKQIDMNKDFRKLKLQSQIIPENIGKGGFDEVVYWSQNAKTPSQIIDLVKAFNRVPYPQQIQDLFTFEQFGTKVQETVYLAQNILQLQEYATFGEKFGIEDQIFWKKIEQKTIRLNPSSPEEIRDSIQVAFIMSKVKKGDVIYSNLSMIFKNMELSTQNTAKLLITYYNLQEGQKMWISQLQKKILSNLQNIDTHLLIDLLIVFKQLKSITQNQQKKIINRIETLIYDFQFKQLCIAAGYIGHDKKDEQFWNIVQKQASNFMKQKQIKTQQSLVLMLQLLSSYSLSKQFIRKCLLQHLRANQFELIHKCQPQIRSYTAKILYIYQLQKQTNDIEEAIQSSIMKQFNTLKNVNLNSLIKVIKDYAVTRNGSRQFYIFLEEVVKALFDDIMGDKTRLEALYRIYQKSNLCSPGLLQKIQYYL